VLGGTVERLVDTANQVDAERAGVARTESVDQWREIHQ